MRKKVYYVSRVKLGFWIGMFEDSASLLECHARGSAFAKEQANLLLADYFTRTAILMKENPQ